MSAPTGGTFTLTDGRNTTRPIRHDASLRVIADAMTAAGVGSGVAAHWVLNGHPPANVWAGVSAENQTYWDFRVGQLRHIPARVRFVSAEPLLGPITMGELRPDWVIVGGESGPGARAMDAEWVKDLQREAEGRVSFFFKQWGGVNKKETGRELNGQTFDQIPVLPAP